MPTFAARRSFRPRVMLAGVAWLVVCAGAAAAIGTGWIAFVGVTGLTAAWVGANLPERVTLVVRDGEIAPSWRPPARGDAAAIGEWVTAGVDTATGVILHAGALRIGAADHDGAGYAFAAPPTRTVDCIVERGDFDALVAAVGVARGEAGPLAAPLVRSSQSVVGLVQMMLP